LTPPDLVATFARPTLDKYIVWRIITQDVVTHSDASQSDSGADMSSPGSPPLTESTFLILLALTNPRHGYAIMQKVAGLSNARVRLGPGTLYGALNALLEKGLIQPVGESDAGGERRKVYALTPAGRKLLDQEVERLQELVGIAEKVLTEGAGQ
jgi:DNA-binding PadR family transcriptional regulator